MAEPNTLPQPPNMQPSPVTPNPQAVQPPQQVPVAPVMVPVYQPIAPQQVVVPEQQETPAERETRTPVLRIYGHSPLFYWWPVWVTGYVMALVTYLHGQPTAIGGDSELIDPNSNVGIVFFVVLFFVILVTSVSVRGLASGMVLLSAAFIVLLISYFNWWDTIFGWLGHFRVHVNFAGYFWFSTLLFVVWAATFFIFDRFTYWEIKPGQITENYFLGGGSRSFDTENMMVEKFRNDLFRHWIIGLGAGDLQIQTTGASKFVIDIHNVLFIGRKVRIIQEMVATIPDQFGHVIVK